MVLTALIACFFRMKCKEVNLGCCKINRDIEAENIELEIENAHRDRIPPLSNVSAYFGGFRFLFSLHTLYIKKWVYSVICSEI
jgi:hypothetical protein